MSHRLEILQVDTNATQVLSIISLSSRPMTSNKYLYYLVLLVVEIASPSHAA
jgi:hypothetical protein